MRICFHVDIAFMVIYSADDIDWLFVLQFVFKCLCVCKTRKNYLQKKPVNIGCCVWFTVATLWHQSTLRFFCFFVFVFVIAEANCKLWTGRGTKKATKCFYAGLTALVRYLALLLCVCVGGGMKQIELYQISCRTQSERNNASWLVFTGYVQTSILLIIHSSQRFYEQTEKHFVFDTS